jgi:hypothetical protein
MTLHHAMIRRIWLRRTRRDAARFIGRAVRWLVVAAFVVYVSLNFVPFADYLRSLQF